MSDSLSPLQYSPWGKFRADDSASHHLAHHCADVAACFLALGRLPVIRARLERAAERPLSLVVLERLAVIVFLHDAGKLHPGFQAKGWPCGIWKMPSAGHVREGAELYCPPGEIARNLLLEDLIRWGIAEGALLVSALSHHGRPISLAGLHGSRWPEVRVPGWDYDPVAASAEMGRAMRDWFPLAFDPSDEQLPDTTAFQHLLCGLVSLADWIGSDSETFHFVPKFDPEYMSRVRGLAEETIAKRRVHVEAFRPLIAGRGDFRAITGFETPRTHQRLVGEAPLGEQLIILEAETGSGKTEAALWRFIRLFEAGKVDSLYFALPTRAAAIQLHSRVNEVLKRLFGEKTLEAVLAVPGYIKAGETHGQPLPDWRVLWDDDPDEEGRQARWAAESAKRYLAAAVAVGTFDQAMLAGLQVKHAHLRAAALSRSLLVVDEIHASDAYMTGVLSHLLKTHLGWGGYAMLMSATLGSIARSKWLGKTGEPPAFEEAAATPYPAIWLKSEARPRSPVQDESGRQKRVSIRLVESMAAEGAAAEAMAAARSGARVLVIRNTVDAAIATWQAVLDNSGGDLLLEVKGGPALHHSRFAAEDRKLLDMAVENALSPKLRQPGGVIVIGTQTLEQSLDIDADLLLTDLCPVDVLLQRIGRLHRHLLDRPEGFESPQCMVMTPEQGLAPLLAPRFENGLGAWKESNVHVGVYTDLCVLELTRRLAIEHPHWTIPKMNRLLVESATHPERIEALHAELGRDWFDYWMQTYGKDVADAGAARSVALPIQATFGETEALFASDEEKIRTRLGAEGAKVEFTEAIKGPFGQIITGITLPAHWSRGVDREQQIVPTCSNSLIEFTIGDLAFHYDHRGLTKISK